MTFLNNAKWVAFSQFFKVFVQLINIVYLARLIPPNEYGVMAMALIVINFGLLIRDLGTAAAIIQRKTINNDIINSVFWLNLYMGFVIAFLIALSSPLISSVFHEPKLIGVLLLISAIFPISSSSSAHLALLERDSRFRVISFIEIFSSVISVVLALSLAYSGFGVYSLVWQTIVLNVISTILFWYVSNWRPSIKKMFHFAGLKDIFAFSFHLSIFNFVNYFSRNADSFIIGRYMSPSILGAYSLAYRVMLFPLQSLTFVVTRSLLPVLSQQQHDSSALKKTYLNCVFTILIVVVPLMTGLAYLSKPFVFFVFGPQWEISAKILVWLAPTAIIQAVLSSTGTVFMAKGRTDILLRLGVLGVVIYMASFLIGVNFDIVTFAFCYFIANVINFFPVMFILLRLIGSGFFELFKCCFMIFIVDFIMLVSLFLLDRLMPSFNDGFVGGYLVVMSIVGFLVYITLSFFCIKNVRHAVGGLICKAS